MVNQTVVIVDLEQKTIERRKYCAYNLITGRCMESRPASEECKRIRQAPDASNTPFLLSANGDSELLCLGEEDIVNSAKDRHKRGEEEKIAKCGMITTCSENDTRGNRRTAKQKRVERKRREDRRPS